MAGSGRRVWKDGQVAGRHGGMVVGQLYNIAHIAETEAMP